MARAGWPPLAWLLLALLAAACVALAVRAGHALMAPLPALPAMAPPAGPDAAILGRFDPFFREAPAEGADLPVTALPLTLKGVRFDAASGRGAAFIAGADGVQRPLAPGDAVMDGVTLAAVAPDHVVLERAGARETLWLDEAGGAAPSTLPSAPDAAALMAQGSAAGIADSPDSPPDSFADPRPEAEDSP